MEHPVGTGAFVLKSWRRGQQIVLEANPNFRDERFPEASDAADRARFAGLQGKKLPLVDRVDIAIMEEANPRMLAFESRALDYFNLPPELSDRALDPSNRLKPDYAARGVTLERLTQPSLQYAYFNMQDPVVGGYTNDKVALRRALVHGLQQRRADSRRLPGPGAAGDAADPAQRAGSRRHAERRGAVRSRRCESAARQIRLRRSQRRRLARHARRQAADARRWRRRRRRATARSTRSGRRT